MIVRTPLWLRALEARSFDAPLVEPVEVRVPVVPHTPDERRAVAAGATARHRLNRRAAGLCRDCDRPAAGVLCAVHRAKYEGYRRSVTKKGAA